MARLAVLCYHTSPLAQPGTGDGGGMNVYVRELSSALARLGHDVAIYTRAESPFTVSEVDVEPGVRVFHVPAGPTRVLAREEMATYVDEFTDGVRALFDRDGNPDVLHANYWLSGLSAHRLKHERGLPMVLTFHTLERVKAGTFEAESPARAVQEAELVGCADAVLASCDVEADELIRLYHADPDRVHVVPLGVEHAFFAPGRRAQARRALGLEHVSTLLLFVGRIQTLKGVDLALETLIELRSRGVDATLAIMGGPSGPQGQAVLSNLHHRVADAGVIEHVNFVAPQSHQLLSTWMRAADATLVPSRAESFGLVALESSACGTPVVASAVGGLTTLVEPGGNGVLLATREPSAWADAVLAVVDPVTAPALASRAVELAGRYTWRRAATKLAALADELRAHQLVSC